MKYKIINIWVEEKVHDEYKAVLKRKGKGEAVKYKLGNIATSFMKRVVGRENHE